jgi:hypothetical protein
LVRAAAVRTKCQEGQTPTTLTRNVRELVPLTLFDQQKDCPTVARKVAQVIPKPIGEAALEVEVPEKIIKTIEGAPKKQIAGYGIKSKRTVRIKSLPTLKSRQEWATMVENLKVGTRVLIKQKGQERHTWPIGVVQTVVRRLGKIKAAAVRSGDTNNIKTLTRPVQELVPLTPKEQETYEEAASILDGKNTKLKQHSFVKYVKNKFSGNETGHTKIANAPTAQEVSNDNAGEMLRSSSRKVRCQDAGNLVSSLEESVETKQTTTTSTENELPDKDASAAVKECPKTPNREGATTKQSGSDGGGTKEIPDQIIAETAKYNQETPECKDPAAIHQDNDNETPN